MLNTLTYHPQDLENFPELERPPGEYRIEASIVLPQRDPRLPVPKGSPGALFVSSTLRAGDTPPDAHWTLAIERLGKDGQPERGILPLVPAPFGGDNRTPPLPRPARLAPGTLLRAIFWADLGPLVKAGQLKPGDRMTVHYGTASAALAWPPR